MLRIRKGITVTQQPSELYPNRNKVLFFPYVNTCTISDSFDTFTGAATIILPQNIKYQNRNIYEGSDPMLMRGDKIKIEAGYHPKIKTIFTGYISKISNNVPIEVKCEDEMFLLKQTISPNLSYKSVNLRTFIGRLLENTNIPFTAINTTLGAIRVNQSNITKVLQVLRETYGIYSFFRDGVLKVGLPYYPNEAVEQTILMERQIISNDMEYLRKEDVKVKVKGVLINADNSRTEIFVGDEDGELRTVFQYGGTTDEIKEVCNRFLEQMNYTGYYGKFTTFLEPRMRHGDYVRLVSYKLPERNGTYLIKDVETSFGVNGGRQIVELERRIL